jgi:ABC-type enterobactin transport system permease subunit
MRQNAGVAIFYIGAVATYLLYGPGVLAYGIFDWSHPVVIPIGLVTTFVGWIILRWMKNRATRPLWYRRY